MHWQDAPAEWEGAAAPLLLTLCLLGLLAWVLYFTAVMQLHYSKVLNIIFQDKCLLSQSVLIMGVFKIQ